MGSRWIFALDGSAVQVGHITRLAISKTGLPHEPYGVLAHLVTNHQVLITQCATFTDAEDAIRDMIVGREYRRS